MGQDKSTLNKSIRDFNVLPGNSALVNSVCKKRYKQLIVNNLTCFIALKGI